MARWLSMQVPMCHRVTAGVRAQGELSGVFGAFPGVEGLQSFLRAVAKMKVPKARLAQCAAAVDELQALIEHSGGSQRRLVAALIALEAGPANAQHPRAGLGAAAGEREPQRRLFEGAADLATPD